ncbi:MAG: HypC/HybG/HupF family hydrogenase formation chaperone [Candidatus Omnitrophica bacterium]|nr:HypC/HybG/HupF family hydrogenase formation chaperone [Candidatus Omnitrophota bacterium]
MCLAVPMKVVTVKDGEAVVELGGVRRKIQIGLVDNVRRGDYVIVHAGFAIQKLDVKEARKTLQVLKQLARKKQA